MKLTLRPEWRLRPLSSFLGLLDIKTGALMVVFFALINKVAGVYGLIAVLTGAGGSAAQLSLYIYSVLGLAALAWGLKAISKEDPKQTLYFAHLFFADHVLSTAWLVFFSVVWWVYTPHDGRRTVNSEAQKSLANGSPKYEMHNVTDAERVEAATALWKEEQGLATAVLVLGWIAKIYFAALMYSYAIHLRKGTYRSLPRSRSAIPAPASTNGSAIGTLPDEEDDVVEDFYRLPIRTSQSQQLLQNHRRSGSQQGSSISSFTDFMSAPGAGRPRRAKPGKSSLGNGIANGNGKPGDDVHDVLFDEEADAVQLRVPSGSGSALEDESMDGEEHDEESAPLVGGANGSASHGRRQSRSRV
ncbi:DUF1753-domain-containing protein [Obba rivulosa]|uniref:DUF1753-domain-containing protein n=1 Tax=Obba rivulosa TaxID=1052685 RepID=A0A8E2J787_9APHY|nr:DUF1753-domain-containing protein [Obba rivulosa]